MAIPFYTSDDEEGSSGRRLRANSSSPEDQQNSQNQHVDQPHLVNPVGDINNNDLLANDAEENLDQVETEAHGESGFLAQLVRELVGVYNTVVGANGANSNNDSRNPGAGNHVRGGNRSSRRTYQPASRLVGTGDNQRSPRLPDLICCHVAANMERSLSRRMDYEYAYEQEDYLDNQHVVGPRASEINDRNNNNNNSVSAHPLQRDTRRADVDDDVSGLGLDIKMHIDFNYQRIGRDLRMVGDNFENETRRRRRRHPAGNHHNVPETHTTTTKFKFEFALKVVIPVTFLGLSLAMLKRSSS